MQTPKLHQNRCTAKVKVEKPPISEYLVAVKKGPISCTKTLSHNFRVQTVTAILKHPKKQKPPER